LTDTVWVGVSAGSMVLTPRIGADFVQWPLAPDDRTPGVVDFAIFRVVRTVAGRGRW
jgi:dipeptidase E